MIHIAISDYFKGTPERQGTLFSIMDNFLNNFDFYQNFKNGVISKEEFVKQIDKRSDYITSHGFGYRLGYFRRLVADDRFAADEVLGKLKNAGIIPADGYYSEELFEDFKKKIAELYEHGCLINYIFPEEERLAYALASVLKPAKVFVAGSYYGYWAAWLLPGIKAAEGSAIYTDIEPFVCELANKNISKLGFADIAKAVCIDAIDALMTHEGNIDLFVLDASGGEEQKPEYRGKGIYGPIIRTARPKLKKGSVILAHNIDRNDPFLQPFFDVVDADCRVQIELPTVCGASVYVVG